MKEQSRALLEKARENIEAIEILLDKGFFAIATGRAYYAMFYCTEAALLELNLEFSSHGEVQGAFGRELIKTGKLPPELHQFLLQAFRQRQEADYDAPSRIDENAALALLEQSRRFYTAIAAFIERLDQDFLPE